jgi:hypothetical protein
MFSFRGEKASGFILKRYVAVHCGGTNIHKVLKKIQQMAVYKFYFHLD